MERLRDFVKQLWSIYLLSAYSHAEVSERFRAMTGSNVEGVFYVYNCLPFGLRTSAYASAKLTAVTAEVVRRSELVTALIVHLDDFGGSIGPEPDHPRMARIVTTAESSGWALAPEKLCIGLDTRIKLLGFVLETGSMAIGVPNLRRDKLRTMAKFVLANHGAVRVRTMCQLVGQILPLQHSLGLVCRLRSRYLLLAIRDAARAQNYNMVVPILGRALDELHLMGGLPHAPARGTDVHAHAPRRLCARVRRQQSRARSHRGHRPQELVRGRLLSSPFTGRRGAVGFAPTRD